MLLKETIAENPSWHERLQPTIRHDPVLSKQEYFNLLEPKVKHLDIWETEYLHVLSGENAVLEWASGTALVPISKILSPEEFTIFKQAYNDKLLKAYPPNNGMTLFPFKRIFIIAIKQ